MLDRREFLAGAITFSALPLAGKTLSTQITHIPISLPEFESFLGVQPIIGQNPNGNGLVFVMEPSYMVESKDGLAFSIDKRTVTFSPFMPRLDMQSVEQTTAMKHAAIKLLLDQSTPFPPKYERLTVFDVQRARSHIAKVTRRGCGNTIIACEEGWHRLVQESKDERFESKDQLRQMFKRPPIIVRTGAVTKEPFVLVGYHGNNAYDTGCILALLVVTCEDARSVKDLKNQLRQGLIGNVVPRLVTHRVENYWRRIL